MLTDNRSRKRIAKRRSARGANQVTSRTLLAGAVAAVTLSGLAGIAGHALALNRLDWQPTSASTTAASTARARDLHSQRRVSLPRETASQRHDILQQRTRESAAHRAARAAISSPYRFMIPPRPRDSAPGPGHTRGSKP